MLDRDRVMLANAERVGQAAMGVISGVQVRFSPEEQVLGVALTLAALVTHHDSHGGTILEAAERILAHFKDVAEVKAVEAYIQGELSL